MNLSNTIERYEKGAGSYDKTFFQACLGKGDIIFDTFRRNPFEIYGKKLLDIGCGTGLSSMSFAENGAEVYGIDASLEMLKRMEAKKFATELKKVYLSQNSIPYDDSFFDIVISRGFFCMFQSLDKLMSEVARAIVSGGVFCFDVEETNETLESATYKRSDMFVYRHGMKYLNSLLTSLGFITILSDTLYTYFDIFSSKPVNFTYFVCLKK